MQIVIDNVEELLI